MPLSDAQKEALRQRFAGQTFNEFDDLYAAVRALKLWPGETEFMNDDECDACWFVFYEGEITANFEDARGDDD